MKMLGMNDRMIPSHCIQVFIVGISNELAFFDFGVRFSGSMSGHKYA